MRSVLALLRVAWLTAASYRFSLLFSLASLFVSVVPIYFVSGAVQKLAEPSIRTEGGEYFGFVIVGLAAMVILSAAASAIPEAIAGSIGNGTFEALLVTRARLPMLLAGLAAYPLLEAFVRAALLVGGAALIGTRLSWGAMPAVATIGALAIVAYGGAGLVAAALVLRFRTSGPLLTAVIMGSGLLGGVYYSTTVIPGWLQSLSGLVPLTYALRAVRRLLMGGGTRPEIMSDVGVLALLAAISLTIGVLAFRWALDHSRRAGTLSQY